MAVAVSKQAAAFDALVRRAHACAMCPRMTPGSAVLGPRNGSYRAKVLFVGEAPGRFGSARTGIPFVGDQSGVHFERLLPYAGLTRPQIFIVNAALCNPRDGLGRNDKPSLAELRNCSEYLEETLDLIRPRYVVTLGGVALQALGLIKRHAITLSENVATPVAWRGTTVVPLYHPSGRAMARRPFAQQAQDYTQLKKIIGAQALGS